MTVVLQADAPTLKRERLIKLNKDRRAVRKKLAVLFDVTKGLHLAVVRCLVLLVTFVRSCVLFVEAVSIRWLLLCR